MTKIALEFSCRDRRIHTPVMKGAILGDKVLVPLIDTDDHLSEMPISESLFQMLLPKHPPKSQSPRF